MKKLFGAFSRKRTAAFLLATINPVWSSLAQTAALPPPNAAPVLDQVRAAHLLTCALVAPPPDWNSAALHGDLSRFTAELCRAVAAAILGEATVRLTSFTTEPEALDAVRGGQAALAVGVTPDAADAAQGQIRFGATIFQDSFAILAHRGAALADLAGHTLCTLDGTPAQAAIGAALVHLGIAPLAYSFQEQGEMESGLLTGRCQAVGAPLSRLGNMLDAYPVLRADTAILPFRAGLTPAVLATAATDPRFAAIADATVSALLLAEAAGVTKSNAGSAADHGDPTRQALLGIDLRVAAALGLSRDWAIRAIGAAGNYGEIFARTLTLPRAENALWSNGGLMAPLPLR